MKFITIILFLFLNVQIAFSQVSQQWVNRYDGPAGSFDIARKMILNSDASLLVFGNSVGLGTSNDIVIIKYSSSGSEEWVTRYDHPNNKSDNMSSADTDNAGNIYITGFITNSSDLSQMAVLKFNSTGSFQWIRTLDTSAFTQSYGVSVIIAPDGNIYATGSARNLASNNDYITLKYSASGELKWMRTFNGSANGEDNPVGIIADDFGDIYVCGTSKGSSNGTNITTIKYDSAGSLLFIRGTNTNPADDDRATSLIIDNNNNIIISGVTVIPSNGFDYFVVKYDLLGNLIWKKTYNGPGSSIDYTYQIVTDIGDNIYVTGSSRNGSSIGSEDVLTIKYDSSGTREWVNRFDGNAGGSDIGYCLAVDSELNVYIGSAIDRGGTLLEIGTIKLNSAGDLEWFKIYSHYSAPEDFPYDIAVDKFDNVYISGISFSDTSDYDITTIKYSQSIGISQIGYSIPEKYTLYQNFPNPFNPITKIKFDIPISGFVSLHVYDLLGKRIASLVDRHLNAGSYEYIFDASAFSSGVYLYSLKSDYFKKSAKMTLIR